MPQRPPAMQTECLAPSVDLQKAQQARGRAAVQECMGFKTFMPLSQAVES